MGVAYLLFKPICILTINYILLCLIMTGIQIFKPFKDNSFSMSRQPLVGKGLLIVEVSRSH
jgi:hypothetical protein